MVDLHDLAYHPFYCEENVWRLAQRPEMAAARCEVVFVLGPAAVREARVACWYQRATEEREAVLWDYHVVLAERAADGVRVWDLDTRLPLPCPAAIWVAATFQDPRLVPMRFHPRFHLVPADVFVRELCSDRSHMKDRRGRWLKPPPPWDPPGVGSNLASWRLEGVAPRGVVLDREGLEQAWDLREA